MPIDNSTRFPKPLAADLRELSEGMAIVIDGDTAPRAIASGKYLFIKNHSTLATGGYHATAAIARGADLTSSNVTPDADGIVNGAFSSLSEHLANQIIIRTNTVSNSFQFNVGNNDIDYSSYTVFQITGYTMVLAIGIAYGGYINCTNFTATRVNYQASGAVQLPCQAICIYTKN